MKTANRIALIYGLSLGAAGAIAYYRGRRGQDLLRDAVLHGAAAGTVFNVVGWMVVDGVKMPVLAVRNSEVTFDKMPKKAVELLSQIDTDTLYADFKENGVKVVAPSGNPSIILQDKD